MYNMNVLKGIIMIGEFYFYKHKKTNQHLLRLDTFNKLGYKAKINTHTTSYIN